ncbi:MAG: flagellar hook-length control protein FliK [Pirellulaceae bacterium]|nr:flagellar hook-length control protein FliK [Pirellulaceae bacterium]
MMESKVGPLTGTSPWNLPGQTYWPTRNIATRVDFESLLALPAQALTKPATSPSQDSGSDTSQARLSHEPPTDQACDAQDCSPTASSDQAARPDREQQQSESQATSNIQSEAMDAVHYVAPIQNTQTQTDARPAEVQTVSLASAGGELQVAGRTDGDQSQSEKSDTLAMVSEVVSADPEAGHEDVFDVDASKLNHETHRTDQPRAKKSKTAESSDRQNEANRQTETAEQLLQPAAQGTKLIVQAAPGQTLTDLTSEMPLGPAPTAKAIELGAENTQPRRGSGRRNRASRADRAGSLANTSREMTVTGRNTVLNGNDKQGLQDTADARAVRAAAIPSSKQDLNPASLNVGQPSTEKSSAVGTPIAVNNSLIGADPSTNHEPSSVLPTTMMGHHMATASSGESATAAQPLAAAGSTSNADAASARGNSPTTPHSATTQTGSAVGGNGATESKPTVSGDGQSANMSQIDRARLVQRVARSFSRLGPDGGNLQLRLHPPELGSLAVQVRLDGRNLSAHMTTQSEMAREVIMESLPQLRSQLADQGFTVVDFSVEVGGQGAEFGGQNDGQQQHSPSNLSSPPTDWRRSLHLRRQLDLGQGSDTPLRKATAVTAQGIDLQA